MFKSFSKIFAAVLASLALAGCYSATELNERAVIKAIGVDFSNGEYSVVVQELSSAQGDDPKSVSQDVKILQAKGPSLLEAFNSIEQQAGKLPLFSHAMVLVLGESVAKEHLNDTLYFFSGKYKLRPLIDVLVAKGTAEDIVAFKDGEKIVKSDYIANVAKNTYEGCDGLKTSLWSFLRELQDKLGGATTSGVRVEDGGLKADEIAVFKGEELVGFMEVPLAKEYLLLNGKTKNLTCDITLPNGEKKPCVVRSSKAKLVTEGPNDDIIFVANVQADLELSHSVGAVNSENIVDVKQAIEREFSARLEKNLYTCTHRYKCDLFGQAKALASSGFTPANKNGMLQKICAAKYSATVRCRVQYFDKGENLFSA